MDIITRPFSSSAAMALCRANLSPLLARILASRGITSPDDVIGDLSQIYHYRALKGATEAASFLADCIAARRPILVVADYDCDGATACAVALRGLKACGANVEYLVPNRMVHGYGLTPGVVDLALARPQRPEVLVTVDNGIASHPGIEHAVANGLEVLVTDHHLPSKLKALPPARVIVDPSQAGCSFASKALAGCGVIWYVLWALQDELRVREMPMAPGYKASTLLPLVAIGTVADVVALDRNNRILVQAGLDRIRKGVTFPGIDALATAGGYAPCDPRQMITTDIAFGIGPRINAAGRLKTMDVGIECLTTDDADRALVLAEELDSLNTERKDVEHDAVVEAVQQALALVRAETWTIAVHAPHWHSGVIGIVAGRIKERRYRPTFVLSTDDATGQIKGSGRSIPGFNLKDALDQVDKACPGLLVKFGGHAMAAGVTLRPDGFEEFQRAFEAQAHLMLTPELLLQQVEVDGSLPGQDLTPATARLLRGPTWGQGFLEPSFYDDFVVEEAKMGGVFKDQLNMVVTRDGVQLKATRFRHEGPVPSGTVRLVYKLSLTHDKFGKDVLKLLVDQVL